MKETLPLLDQIEFPRISREAIEVLQVNLGYRCNQQCLHCHVNAGPNRKESMQLDTVHQVLRLLEQGGISTLDLTGGAPELNPHFRYLVSRARAAGVHVIDRCNLTILHEPGQQDLGEFLAHHRVEVVASLPCYAQANVDQQRGAGVFEKSITALRQLNRLGYGGAQTGLVLNLVFNPQGPALPPAQYALEQDYKQHLQREYQVVFNQLFTLTNMPIQRFGSTLLSKGKFDDYMNLLIDSHQQENLGRVMCLRMLSVDWQGYLYDCDFNQMLGLGLESAEHGRMHLSELDLRQVLNLPIRTAGHCYACTAGQGSSCGGAL